MYVTVCISMFCKFPLSSKIWLLLLECFLSIVYMADRSYSFLYLCKYFRHVFQKPLSGSIIYSSQESMTSTLIDWVYHVLYVGSSFHVLELIPMSLSEITWSTCTYLDGRYIFMGQGLVWLSSEFPVYGTHCFWPVFIISFSEYCAVARIVKVLT